VCDAWNEHGNEEDIGEDSDPVEASRMLTECNNMHQVMIRRVRSSIVQPTASSAAMQKPQQPPGVSDFTPLEVLGVVSQGERDRAMEGCGNNVPVSLAAIDRAIREQAGTAGTNYSQRSPHFDQSVHVFLS
jgi:hypothetical protein